MSMTSSTERDILRLVRDLIAPDDKTNWRYLAEAYGCLVAVTAVWLAYKPWWLYPVLVVLVGAFVQARISALAHEASHFLLFKNRRLNDFVADGLCIFPLFGSIKRYREIHLAHHWHTNDPAKDPDLARVTKLYRLSYPLSRKSFYRDLLLKQLTPPLGLRYLLALSGQYSLKTEPRNAQEVSGGTPVWFRIGWYAAWTTVIAAFDLWETVALLWFVPFVAIFPVVLSLREVAEHGMAPERPEMLVSRRFELGWPLQGVLFPTGLDNHQLHHLCPSIPHHKLEQAHQRLMASYPPYRNGLVTCRGFDRPRAGGPSVLEVLAGKVPAAVQQTEAAS
jgi:fatty acid desaturase